MNRADRVSGEVDCPWRGPPGGPGWTWSFLVLLHSIIRTLGLQDLEQPPVDVELYQTSTPDDSAYASDSYELPHRNSSDIYNISTTDAAMDGVKTGTTRLLDDFVSSSTDISTASLTETQPTLGYDTLVTFNMTINATGSDVNPYETTYYAVAGLCLSLIFLLVMFLVIILVYTHYRSWKQESRMVASLIRSPELPDIQFARRNVTPQHYQGATI